MALLIATTGCGSVEQLVTGRRSNTEVVEISASENDPIEEVPAISVAETDWAWWRGPGFDGKLTSVSLPEQLATSNHLVWEVKIPGRGHSSPTIVGNRIYLLTADDENEKQMVLALNRGDGGEVWRKVLHSGNFTRAMHNENTHASSTIACDGERLFVLFLNNEEVTLHALTLDGDVAWQENLGYFDSKFGFSASPLLYKEFVIVTLDHDAGPSLVCLNRETGEIRWRKKRPRNASFTSPVIYDINGEDRLFVTGADALRCYNPATGEEIFEAGPLATTCVGTPVIDENLIFASGGYPQKNTLCIDAVSGEVKWQNKVKVYVPSLIAHDGYLYAVNDDGIGYCWDATTGEEQWKKRVGGNYRCSLSLFGETLLIGSMKGDLIQFAATPEGYNEISREQLGTEIFATPSISDQQLFIRYADNSQGERQEYLRCLNIASADQQLAAGGDPR